MTDINNITDLAQVLRDNPQWRDIIRAILLGDELLEIPGRFAEMVKVMEMVLERLDRLESDVAELKSDVAELKAGQARLESNVTDLKTGQETLTSRLGNIIGSDCERRAAQSARRLARLGLGVRRARVLLARTVPDRNEIPELLDEATEIGTVNDDEADDLLLADIVLLGESAEGSPAYAVCETAVAIYNDEVTRAQRRAKVLEKASGVPAIPAIIGQSAPRETLELAEREKVAFISLPDREDAE